MLQDPVPSLDLRAKQETTLASLSVLKSKKRVRNHDEDQILISSDEDGGSTAKFVSYSDQLIPEQEGMMPYRKV
jgi:hypothetical protein